VKRLAFLFVLLLAAVGATAAAAKGPHLSRADRNGINKTLDAFVVHAVARHDVAKSYDLVTPYLRGGTDRKHWTPNNLPVYPYPAAGTKFHHWKLDYVDAGDVGIELMLRPRKGANTNTVIFNIDLKQGHGRWLVDSFLPAASFAPVGKKASVTAIADYGAKAAGSGAADGKARLNPAIAYLPFAFVGLLLAALVSWGISRRVRARRAYAAAASSSTLPPLPRR
jgi:hypothetical protein